MNHPIVSRYTGRLDLTGVYLFKKHQQLTIVPKRKNPDAIPFVGGIIAWMVVFGALWMIG
ncbi:MAG: hypothetical protein ACE5FN_09345 [Leptospirillia bacterium]